jgi:hypothetical protein
MAREVTLERGDGYGFHLASENGNQFIRKIDKKSPAEHAGILDGDRLIGVNTTCIIGLSHKEVVGLIRQSNEAVRLVLVTATNEIGDLCDNDLMRLLWPREVTLTRKQNGFGFVLHSERVRKTTKYFMTKITAGGAADEVGVANDDRLIKINDSFITWDVEHKDVVQMIKNEMSMSLLLCHRASTFSSLQVYEKLRDKSLVSQLLEKPTRDLEPSAITAIESPESVHSNSDSNETQNEAPRIEEETNYDQKDSEKENDIEQETPGQSEFEKTSESDSESIKSQSMPSTVDTTSDSSTTRDFSDMDFSRMSLQELKQSIRSKPNAKRGPSVSEINWEKQKSVFKEL